MTAAELVAEEWIYAGERLDSNDKLYTVWIDPSGEELHFRKLAAGIPGQVYKVEVDRSDGVRVSGSPRYLAELANRSATPAQIDSSPGLRRFRVS